MLFRSSVGIATNKIYGAYIVDSNSVSSERKSGCSILPVNAEIGITLDRKTLAIIAGLKRMGFENIEEAERANACYFKCKDCQMEGLAIPTEIMIDDKKEIMFRCPNPKCPKNEKNLFLTNDEKENLEIKVPVQTFNFYDLIRYFKYYMSSALMMSTIERKVHDELSKIKSCPFKAMGLFIGIGVMFLCIGMAFMLITQNLGSAPSAASGLAAVGQQMVNNTGGLHG